MKRLTISIVLAFASIILSINKVFAEELIKITGGELLQLNNNKEIKITKDNLYISDDIVERNENNSIRVKLNVFNPNVMDGLLEIYDKNGKIVDLKIIEGNSAPDNIIDAAKDYGTGFYNDFIKYGFSDPRAHIKKTELEFTLDPEQTANFTTSSKSVLIYNAIIAAFDALSLLTPETGKEYSVKNLTLDFVKDLIVSGSKDVLTNSVIKSLSDNRTIKEKLKSDAFLDLFKYFKEYTNKRAKESNHIDSIAFETSSLLNNSLKAFGPAGAFAEGTFKFATITNSLLRIEKAVKSYWNKVPSLNIANVNRNSSSNIETGLLDASSCITQVSSSHIGSASCSFPSSNQPVQDEIITQFQETQGINPSIQEANQYTNGQIVRAPLDIGLTWNQSTLLDLDSHLVTPNDQHVYFANRGSLDTAPNAFLYRDSIPASGQLGAEQTRITQFQPGEYRFFVYNFSESINSAEAQAAGPNGLSNAAPVVQLFEGGKPLSGIPNDPNSFDLNNPNLQNTGQPYPGNSTFQAPLNQTGNLWYVFKLDTRTGIVYKVNRFGSAPNSGAVPNAFPNP